MEIKFWAPPRCVCAMVWRFHAIDATLSRGRVEVDARGGNALVDFRAGHGRRRAASVSMVEGGSAALSFWGPHFEPQSAP